MNSLFSCLFKCSNPEDTQAIAARLAHLCVARHDQDKGLLILLEGHLGAGKTCFSQGFIQSLLPDARVKSPTYTLVESYEIGKRSLYHLDLYRLNDPEELEYLGLREFLWHNICLIEWASRAEAWLPSPDLMIQLQREDGYHQLLCEAYSAEGVTILTDLS